MNKFFKKLESDLEETQTLRGNVMKGWQWLIKYVVAVPHGSGSLSNGGLSATADPTNPVGGSFGNRIHP